MSTIHGQDYWIRMYQRKEALWIHDENARRPHALLTSGKHSGGFFNSELVLEDPVLLDSACYALVDKLERVGVSINRVDRVVGPAMGAITLAHDIARRMGQCSAFKRTGFIARGYTEKDDSSGSKKMVFSRVKIKPGEHIFAVEDVLTTGSSVELMANAIAEAGGVMMPFVAVLVNRSGLSEVAGRQIVALIDRPMPMWDPAECPLCKQGSEAIRPKGADNWVRLNAAY